MTPLPEPTYYLASNGRLMQTDGDVDCTGKKLAIYATDELCSYGAAEYKRGIEDAMNCYSPDDSATDWMDKIRKLGEKS